MLWEKHHFKPSGEDLNEKCIKYNVVSAIINVYGQPEDRVTNFASGLRMV